MRKWRRWRDITDGCAGNNEVWCWQIWWAHRGTVELYLKIHENNDDRQELQGSICQVNKALIVTEGRIAWRLSGLINYLNCDLNLPYGKYRWGRSIMRDGKFNIDEYSWSGGSMEGNGMYDSIAFRDMKQGGKKSYSEQRPQSDFMLKYKRSRNKWWKPIVNQDRWRALLRNNAQSKEKANKCSWKASTTLAFTFHSNRIWLWLERWNGQRYVAKWNYNKRDFAQMTLMAFMGDQNQCYPNRGSQQEVAIVRRSKMAEQCGSFNRASRGTNEEIESPSMKKR